MPKATPQDKRAKLNQQKAEIAAQLRALDAKEKQSQRKDDTRRKVIVGALAWEHAAKNPQSHFALKLRELITDYVKPDARRLFDFLAAPDATQPSASSA